MTALVADRKSLLGTPMPGEQATGGTTLVYWCGHGDPHAAISGDFAYDNAITFHRFHPSFIALTCKSERHQSDERVELGSTIYYSSKLRALAVGFLEALVWEHCEKSRAARERERLERDLDVEHDIIVRMPPAHSVQTVVHARYMGPPTLHVVFDPLVGD